MEGKKGMKKLMGIYFCLITVSLGLVNCDSQPEISGEKIELIVRGDDLGMTHSCNLAVQESFERGILTSSSIIVSAPWFEEAVRMCRENPKWCIGVHLTLNSEWKDYRWGPVLPVTEVPSLVDEDGYFYPTEEAFLKSSPNLDEVEKELRAQVELALKRQINVLYIDTHMGTARSTPELHEIVWRIAQDYNLPLSQEAGEQRLSIYEIPYQKKGKALEDLLQQLEPGLWLLVVHPGLDTLESRALVDISPDGLPDVPAHRAAVTRALTSKKVKKIIKQRNIQLTDYRGRKTQPQVKAKQKD